ncbi:MAG: hypothetical protein QOF73_2712 [Thermomicrobiales bacterium]|nr:hypothetical protein [Thermomicrobiales bacterium]
MYRRHLSPVLTAVAWAMFVAPNASVAVPGAAHLLLQIAVFGSAAAALVRLGQRLPAGAFGLIAVANAVLMAVWNQ